jgi:hypothetical protein
MDCWGLFSCPGPFGVQPAEDTSVHCSHISTLSNIRPGYLNILKNHSENFRRSRPSRHSDHHAAHGPPGPARAALANATYRVVTWELKA